MANPFEKKNMRILVTGSSGLLGKSLCPMLDNEGWQYWACNSKIFDITNTKMVNEIMNKISLDFIIHLAGINRPLTLYLPSKLQELQDRSFWLTGFSEV